jgi:hypothetical protein
MKITTTNKSKTDMENTMQSIKKSGSLNPMWGKRHDSETKKKISDAQKKRYAAIRKALSEQDIIDYGKTDMEARKDVLRQLLDRNQLSFQSVQQAANFFAIMLDEEKIKRIIQEQIDKFVNGCKPTDKRHL